MKKLKLDLSNMKGAEILTREQLKSVVGGSGDDGCTYTSGGATCSSSSGNCQWLYCNSAKNLVIGVCCNGQKHKNPGFSCPDACCDS